MEMEAERGLRTCPGLQARGEMQTQMGCHHSPNSLPWVLLLLPVVLDGSVASLPWVNLLCTHLWNSRATSNLWIHKHNFSLSSVITLGSPYLLSPRLSPRLRIQGETKTQYRVLSESLFCCPRDKAPTGMQESLICFSAHTWATAMACENPGA